MPPRKQKKNMKKLADVLKECRISKLSSEKNETGKSVQPENPSGNVVTITDSKQNDFEDKYKNDPKVPPIFLHQPVDFKEHVYKVLLSGVKFYQPHKGFNYTKIKCVSFEDHRGLIQYLKGNQLPYHTYGNPDHRKSKMVIRGLAKDTCLDTLKEELEFLKIPVVRLNKMHTKQTAKEHPLLVMIIVPNEAGEKLIQVETLLGRTVKIEHPFAKAKQCHRCQKWGHSQRYCHGQIRCVKCAGKHFSSKCMRNRNCEPPKCANCGGDHTASYRKCSYCPDSEIYKQTQKIKLDGVQFDSKPKLVTLSNYKVSLYRNSIAFHPIDDEIDDTDETAGFDFENVEEVD